MNYTKRGIEISWIILLIALIYEGITQQRAGFQYVIAMAVLAFPYVSIDILATWMAENESARQEKRATKEVKDMSDAEELRQRIQRVELTLSMKPLAKRKP